MFALVSSESMHVPAAAMVRLPATWQEYQTLCPQRGDASLPRLKYRLGKDLLMPPLPRHGRAANLLVDNTKTLLDHFEREYGTFTPITMERPEVSGSEPDYCFFVDHWRAVASKERIDWRLDPPPDLVLDIAVTSSADVYNYLPYGVLEVSLLRHNALCISQLQGEEYVAHTSSRYFLVLNLHELVARCLHIAYQRNTSVAIQDLQPRLRSAV